MEHYKNLFTKDYIEVWSYKTNESNTPVEKRVKCDCDAEEFIMMIEDHEWSTPVETAPLATSSHQSGAPTISTASTKSVTSKTTQPLMKT